LDRCKVIGEEMKKFDRGFKISIDKGDNKKVICKKV